MPETTPPKLTDGSLYAFRIGYHLPGNATLFEEYQDTDLAAAIAYAQGRIVTTEAVNGTAPVSETVLIPQGEGRVGAIRRANVLYVSAEHILSEASRTNRKQPRSRWKIVRPGQEEESATHESHADEHSESTEDRPGGAGGESPEDEELRLGYAKGYERGVDDIMARCEVLLKETAVLNVLRRYAFTRRQGMSALITQAREGRAGQPNADADGIYPNSGG